MIRDLTPAVEALAARVGVRIQRGRNPGDPVFPWSFHVGENDRLADMHIVGPGVVYVRPDARVSVDVPAWAVLLHEVGHAATGSPDESIVAGWTDAAARLLRREAIDLRALCSGALPDLLDTAADRLDPAGGVP